MDYVHTVQRLAALQEEISEDLSSPIGAEQRQELDELTRRVPKIISSLPNVFSRRQSGDTLHAAALEQMVKELISLVEKIKPSMLVCVRLYLRLHPEFMIFNLQSQIPQSTLSGADEATKLGLVKGTGYARFLKSIEIGIYS